MTLCQMNLDNSIKLCFDSVLDSIGRLPNYVQQRVQNSRDGEVPQGQPQEELHLIRQGEEVT